VILFLTLISIVVVSAGWTPRITPELSNTLLNIVDFLIYAFTLTVVIDMFMALLIAFLEGIAVLVRQERVSY
jgi:hypothetical protein